MCIWIQNASRGFKVVGAVVQVADKKKFKLFKIEN